MRPHHIIGASLAVLVCLWAADAKATNGDNLISVGPVSRSMGGVGIAAPQDAISAVFANPAAMCTGPYCLNDKAELTMTLFKPTVKTSITKGDGTHSAESEEKVYPIPAVAYSHPLTSELPNWRFGFAAYGSSGMGVDYRDTDIDRADANGFAHSAGTYTDLQRMKAAPAFAFQPHEMISLGAALHVHRATLDLGNRPKEGVTVGIQPGLIFRPTDEWSLGLTYVSPQKIKHKHVSDFDGDGTLDHLTLESPQMWGGGVAWKPNMEWLIETDVKWYNWGDAEGYTDFGWEDQWVYNIGVQWRADENWTVRGGWNYAEHPVKLNDNFNGRERIAVQGKTMMRYYYETFRLVGFPAIAEHHLTLGLSYAFTDTFSLDASYMHAFENKVSEDGTDIYGNAANIESTMAEDSLGLGLSWIF